MYASASTQQPAAICALKSPADAIHVLEAVRVGLVPRVTRRLTGHERAQIRPGTVWVWEEEETNMRRWTDGRRWGASRVGGGGFLVYTESSESMSPPARSGSPNSYGYPANYYPPNNHREALIKQTYSTSMTHPVSGKVKKFHVVGYSSKHNPQGDAHNPLPLPHQLPLLANLQVAPGIWPEWERRRDGKDTAAVEPVGKKSGGGSTEVSPTNGIPPQQQQQQQPSPESSAGYSNRAPSSAPPMYAPDPRMPPQSAPYNPPYYYPPPSSRSAPPYQSPLPPPHQVNDRYHPYRDSRPPLHSSASSSQNTLPPPSSTGEGGYDDRRASSGSSPNSMAMPSIPPPPPGQSSYPYPMSSPYGPPFPPRDPYRRDEYPESSARPAFQSQMMPPNSYSSLSGPTNAMNHNYHQPQYHQHPYQPRNQPSPAPPQNQSIRHASHSPSQTFSVPGSAHTVSPVQSKSGTIPEQSRQQRSPKLSISAALGDGANTGNLTLPPLRVAIDENTGRRSPAGQGVKLSPGLSPSNGEGKRELGELGKKVSL